MTNNSSGKHFYPVTYKYSRGTIRNLRPKMYNIQLRHLRPFHKVKIKNLKKSSQLQESILFLTLCCGGADDLESAFKIQKYIHT